MKHKGMKRQLFLSHLGVALVSLLVIIIIVNISVSITFGKYVENQLQAEADAILQDLTESYVKANEWSRQTLMGVGHRAMQRDMTVILLDTEGNVIWDSTKMGMHMERQGTKHSCAVDDKLPHSTYSTPIIIGDQQVGMLHVGLPDGQFQEQEREFITRFNGMVGGALLIVIVGVYYYSVRISRGISHPLLHMKEKANRMRTGDLTARVETDTLHGEIQELGQAVNHLAESLQKQERLRKNLTADIAHELRTPLATIQSYMEAFEDGIWEPTSEKLQICQEQTSQLVLLIKDLEKLTEAENPMLRLQKEQVNLPAIIAEAQKSIAELWDKKRIRYVPPFTDNIFVHADYRRLLQVFTNLLSNAYKYTPEDGEVSVAIEEQQSNIVINVADTGVGIREEELPYVFERFYRGEKSRSRKSGGAGIGLAIVKAIIEAHGGEVRVESKAGKGTTFLVRLPM
ncbi:sensor histidine kinase [Brevibacillus laterosporus]|uniref:sensor histidine kinase n=1 Tax=Brevibacillus laterosporus TaxID=1465 RepID=UPI000EAC69AF|nr:ATP-binding protein [Brevibacillus laterosporus]AYK06356.1 HAMP domain-containing protein [Brevibacillus laterosporus]